MVNFTCSPALAAMLENPNAPPNLDCQMALLLARCMNWYTNSGLMSLARELKSTNVTDC